MKKNIYLILSLFIITLTVNAEQKFAGTIVVNKAVDKRELNYDENKFLKKYGNFEKEYLVGGRVLFDKITDPFIADEPITISLTKKIHEALQISNFKILNSSDKNTNIINIDINKLFMSIFSNQNTGTYYKTQQEVIIYLKNQNNTVLLSKTFSCSNYIDNRYFSTASSISNYLVENIYNQLKYFLKSDVFLEAYNGRKKIFKDYIDPNPIAIDLISLGKTINKFPSTIQFDVDSISIPGQSIKDISLINNYNNLYELNFSRNPISSIPNLDNLNVLEYLYLNSCYPLKFIDNIKTLKNLIYLDLSKNTHIKNYKSINLLKKLEYLSLNSNFISKLDKIDNLTNLTELDIGLNRLTKIPDFKNNLKLTSLNIYYNKLTKIKNLEKLTNLENLDLSRNKINKIENLEKLSNLKILNLENNPISKIENLNKLVNLEDISLWGTKINKIENLEDLVSLKKLYLARTDIKKIENLDNLLNLTILNLKGTPITKIEGINNLINLEELYLAGTKISQLNNIENLKKLKVLDISNTKIKSLKIIENFPELTTLDITKSKIEKLESIEKCPNLTKIKTEDIQIDYISRASYEYMKKREWTFMGSLSIDEFIKKYFVKIVD